MGAATHLLLAGNGEGRKKEMKEREKRGGVYIREFGDITSLPSTIKELRLFQNKRAASGQK